MALISRKIPDKFQEYDGILYPKLPFPNFLVKFYLCEWVKITFLILDFDLLTFALINPFDVVFDQSKGGIKYEVVLR